MVQETGETRDAIIEDDNKQIQDIVYANRNKTEPYWILIFAKPSKTCFAGKPTLMKHIKPYNVRPASQVGQIIGEVDNSKGTIEWEVNMPQRPFDYNALQLVGGKPCHDVVTETTSIPRSYITK